MNEKEKDMAANIAGGVLGFVLALIIALAFLTSCNVTRTVTTTAQTIQRGDTTTVIMTKTIESYDGKVDASKLLQAGAAAGGL